MTPDNVCFQHSRSLKYAISNYLMYNRFLGISFSECEIKNIAFLIIRSINNENPTHLQCHVDITTTWIESLFSLSESHFNIDLSEDIPILNDIFLPDSPGEICHHLRHYNREDIFVGGGLGLFFRDSPLHPVTEIPPRERASFFLVTSINGRERFPVVTVSNSYTLTEQIPHCSYNEDLLITQDIIVTWILNFDSRMNGQGRKCILILPYNIVHPTMLRSQSPIRNLCCVRVVLLHPDIHSNPFESNLMSISFAVKSDFKIELLKMGMERSSGVYILYVDDCEDPDPFLYAPYEAVRAVRRIWKNMHCNAICAAMEASSLCGIAPPNSHFAHAIQRRGNIDMLRIMDKQLHRFAGQKHTRYMQSYILNTEEDLFFFPTSPIRIAQWVSRTTPRFLRRKHLPQNHIPMGFDESLLYSFMMAEDGIPNTSNAPTTM